MAKVVDHLVGRLFSKKAQQQIETLLGNASNWYPEQQAEVDKYAKEVAAAQDRGEQRMRNISKRLKSKTITIRLG